MPPDNSCLEPGAHNNLLTETLASQTLGAIRMLTISHSRSAPLTQHIHASKSWIETVDHCTDYSQPNRSLLPVAPSFALHVNIQPTLTPALRLATITRTKSFAPTPRLDG